MVLTKTQKIGRFGLMVFSLLMSFSVLLAGCTNTVQKTRLDQGSDGSPEAGKSMAEDVALKQTTRSEQEVMQEDLARLIADGGYNDKVTYEYHDGTETIDIYLEIKDDIVKDVMVSGNDPHKVSAKYINGVNEALPDMIIGRKIDQLDLPDQISGSSLTVGAFKQHVADLIEKY